MKRPSDFDDHGPPWYRSTRYLLALLSFFGMFNTFLQRIDLSMAIVCMVNHTAVDLMSQETVHDNASIIYMYVDSNRTVTENISTPISNGNMKYIEGYPTYNTTIVEHLENVSDVPKDRNLLHSSSCAHNFDINSNEREDGELVWSKEAQGLVLGGLFWGYVFLQVVCAFIIRRWGAKRVVGTGMVLMSVLTLLTPVTARWSPWALVVLRAVMGAFNGFTVPGFFAIWGKWAPPTERSRLVAFSFSGNMAATAAVFPVSAFLCKVPWAGGWPLIFYIYGGMGLCWTILWMYCVYDDPAHHPRIHPKERQFLQEVLGATKTDRSMSIPWLKIFTSIPYLSIMVAQFTFNWSLFLLMSNLPIYMREIMHFDIKSNGVYSFIPYLVTLVATVLASICADALIGRRLMSVAYTRKLMTLVGHFIPGILMVVLSYLDCTQSQLAVALLSLAIGLGGCAFSGILVNFYDIAPMFAAPMMTISNSVSAIPGILAPYVVAELTKDKTREQWQIVFFLTAGLLALGTLMHVVLGKGHVQPWAVIRDPARETVTLPSS